MMRSVQQLRGDLASRNLNQLQNDHKTIGERLSDGLARFGGSWTFIIVFCTALVFWIGVNSLQLLMAPFDSYPYLLLNLVLSGLAAAQAAVILMAQNRQAARDRLAAELDDACWSQAEQEIQRLHEKLDLLREKQWVDLVETQQYQTALLHELLDQRDRGSPSPAEQRQRTEIPLSEPGHSSVRRPPDGSPAPLNAAPECRPRRRARIVDGQTHLRRRRGLGDPGSLMP
jgi:uncharacterized membrane protein